MSVSGKDTLHGGFNGTDLRTWTISEQSTNSVTFTLVDPNGMEGWLGTEALISALSLC